MIRHPQQTSSVVREARLRQFQSAVGHNLAQTLSRYHAEFVEPRLRWLELPFYKQWYYLTKGFCLWALQYLRKRPGRLQEPSEASGGPPTPPPPPSTVSEASRPPA